MLIEPLRKMNDNGVLYTRSALITDFIEKASKWSFDEIIEFAKNKDNRSPGYIPSEVLIYFLRQTKTDNSDDRFLDLFNIVQERVRGACPRAFSKLGDKEIEDTRLAEIRDLILDHVTELIFSDRSQYNDKLDYYEVRFNRAVKMLRIDKFRSVRRREEFREPLEYSDGSGEFSAEVEEAVKKLKSARWSKEEDLTYRINVRRAINALPDNEREVIDMLLADIPIETKNEEETSISKLLNCSEKTVRNRRDRAIEKIRTALNEENVDGL